MPGKLKIEIVGDKNVLEIYEAEAQKLTFVMYRDDPKDDTFLEIVTDTSEFTSLLKRLLDISEIIPLSNSLSRKTDKSPNI